MVVKRLGVIVALFWVSGACVLAAGFTIEQALSAPFPSDLTAAPSGGAVAWVFNDRGIRNIWIADPPGYRGRKVTAYAEDDGLEITDLSITPDGKRIVYVRGSGANRRGEVPNPTSRADGTEQAVFAVPTSGGEPRRLAVGRGVAVAPKGDQAAYVARVGDKDQVFLIGLEGEAKATQLFKARGDEGSLS
ncbi:MAG TPA: S9 family peptidase, partial [Thermoanaerobaculia bacterium]|nr:S9 family peptidase [Thermoanaerobaculia bacterium]